MSDEVIPVVMFLVIGAIFVAASYFRFRARQEQQISLRELLARGHDASPEMIELMTAGLSPDPRADLRKGVIGVMLGLALLIVAVAIGDSGAQQVFRGLSAFPIMVGIGYLLLWWLNQRKS